MFNSDVTTFLVQCGILSEKIKIERGCKQGDPISSYLFLTAAEILAIVIKINPEIIGIKVNMKEFKLMQFADDTTLFLDGTQHSLQAALNTLEIFGNFSGLRMNKEKTKIIWIEKKRFSKFKLNVSQKTRLGLYQFHLFRSSLLSES